jgi:hypothetical protein
MSKNITKEEAVELSKRITIVPLFSKVLISLNSLDADGALVLSENVLSDRQYIIATGSNVLSVNDGDEVLIDIDKLMVPVKTETVDAYQIQQQVKIDPIEFEGYTFALIEDRFLKAKYK